MKILIVRLRDAHPDHLLENESLENVRSLMAAGCYGRLRDLSWPNSDPFEAINDYVTSQGARSDDVSQSDGIDPWAAARKILEANREGYLRIEASVVDGDEGLGSLLGLLSDETVILVVASSDTRCEAFVLVSARNPLNGEIENTRLRDLVPTIFDLVGFDRPTAMPGRSLVAGLVVDASPADKEQLVRDRLRGLGYIA